jgi:carboxypeptidase Q
MPTLVPKWVRGQEWASMTVTDPTTGHVRVKQLHMVGLGMSVNTSGVNITAPLFVVSSNDDLQANCSTAAGKIVLFNVPFTEYGITVQTRLYAGTWGAACGAVAALIRTVGPFSMQSPHTGATNASAPIPSAAVSLEDASQMARMQARGQGVVVSLYMESVWFPPSPSRNILIDLVGSERPYEYVMIGGHGDSWDIAEGAMDDGGGMVSSWEAVRVLSALGLKPKRTVRAVVWVNEENGSAGGLQYAADLGPTGGLLNHSIALETDSGAFQPFGIGLSCACNAEGTCTNGGCGAAIAQLQLIGSALLGGIGSGNVTEGGDGTDIEPTCATGVPCSGLNVLDPRLTPDTNNPCIADSMGAWTNPTASGLSSYDSGYFFYHHSASDTMERMDPRQLNHVSAALAVWAYSIAQLPELLPRDAPAPPEAPSNANSAPADAGAVAGGVVGGLVGLALLAWVWKTLSTRPGGIGGLGSKFGGRGGAGGQGEAYADLSA